jgi:phosphate transport system permease protein
MKYRKGLERSGRTLLLLSALLSVVTVILITLFIFSQGLPLFKDVSLWEFVSSTDWSPSAESPHYGVFSFIYASFVVTFLSLLFALPLSLATAIHLALFAKGKVKEVITMSVELLSGIPSVIFGLFGIAVIVPMVRALFGGNGYSLLSSSLILAIMVMPTLINVSEVAIASVSSELKEASYGLGATTAQTIFRAILPTARSGITAAIVLSLGRAVGETTAVLLVGGNAPLFPSSPVSMGRTLTMNIVTDMGYAEGTHMSALFATAMLLFVVILLLNGIVTFLSHRSRTK